jgi:hypothetical protein
MGGQQDTRLGYMSIEAILCVCVRACARVHVCVCVRLLRLLESKQEIQINQRCAHVPFDTDPARADPM